MKNPIIQIKDLSVTFPSESGLVNAVRSTSLEIYPGEVLGLVGESGSGKSVMSLATIGLLPDSASVTGEVNYQGRNLLTLNDSEMSKLRGKDISMIFQDPLSALNPVQSIGDQIAESIRVHQGISEKQIEARVIELLDAVGIPFPKERALSYPHEFSGGMRQRVMIAMAIANEPKILLADEPTTALDVTVQAQVIETIKLAKDLTGAAVVLVTHDMGVVAGLADRIAIMYAGKIVEVGPVNQVFSNPRMPYTIGLIKSIPRVDSLAGSKLVSIEGTPPSPVQLPDGCAFGPRCPAFTQSCAAAIPALISLDNSDHLAACHRVNEIPEIEKNGGLFKEGPESVVKNSKGAETVLEVNDLKKTFPLMKGSVLRRRVGSIYAVDGVSLTLQTGRSLALVGESGCGKTTTLIEIMNLLAPENGQITFLSKDVATLSKKDRLSLRKDLAMVFQDPSASFDPRLPVSAALTEGMEVFGASKAEREARSLELLELVGLNPLHANRFPAEFSGGQRQRLAIARALALNPKVIVLDEPVSALDVSVRAGILNLLAELQNKLQLSYLIVSHDLSVIRHIADDVAVMYLGSIVETGPISEVFKNPKHPYTQALLSAVPIPDPKIERERERIVLTGELPSPANPPSGCRFHNRCHIRQKLSATDQNRCATDRPQLKLLGDESVACHFPITK
jgi:peptide/nickel transport system ATP-binding protein